jgi:hypothetical protein
MNPNERNRQGLWIVVCGAAHEDEQGRPLNDVGQADITHTRVTPP